MYVMWNVLEDGEAAVISYFLSLPKGVKQVSLFDLAC